VELFSVHGDVRSLEDWVDRVVAQRDNEGGNLEG